MIAVSWFVSAAVIRSAAPPWAASGIALQRALSRFFCC
jgi:hypothetical protein